MFDKEIAITHSMNCPNEPIGQAVITTFSAMWWLHHPCLCLLWRWSRTWHKKNEFKKEIDRTGHLKSLKLQWETKKSKYESFNKEGSYRWRMTRRFKIWSQNLNQTSFNPLLANKSVETGFASFWSFVFAKKGIKCCSIQTLRPDLKFSRHLLSIWQIHVR